MTRSSTTRVALALLALCTLPGCLDQVQLPSYCGQVSLRVLPGKCVTISNPCRTDGRWSALDGFSVSGDWMSIETEMSDGIRTRQICVAPEAPVVRALGGEYTYAIPGLSNSASGTFMVTTAPALDVVATASPAAIRPGEKALLVAAVSSGVPPFSYAWSPAEGLSDSTVADPAVSPTSETVYAVTVTDSVGQQETVRVRVTIRPASCGDAVVDLVTGEECDDGNTASGDGCSATCRIEGICLPLSAACVSDGECCSGACGADTGKCRVPPPASCLAEGDPCDPNDGTNVCCSGVCSETNQCEPG